MSTLNRQLVLFFALAYGISWVIWLPLNAPALGWGNDWPIIPYHHAMGGWGPLIAAFIVKAVYDKEDGVWSLINAMVKTRPVIYLFIALFSPWLISMIAGLVEGIASGVVPNLSGWGESKEFPAFHLPEFFLYNLVFFGFGEETGWRGFALPRFQAKYNALTSSLIMSVLWAIWHWPLFFYRAGYDNMDLGGVFGWLFSMVTGSVLLTWLFNSTRGSVLICAIFHATVDIAFTSDMANENMVQYSGALITIWGVLVILLFKARNLSPHIRVQSPLL